MQLHLTDRREAARSHPVERALGETANPPYVRRMIESERSSACPACLFPLSEPIPDSCPECGASIAAASSFDHVAIIRAQGEMLRRGASNPSGVVVVGMWMLFGPAMVAFVLIGLFSKPASLLTTAPFLLLYGAILWKVTSRYRAARREAAREEHEHRYEEPYDHWSDG